MTEEEEQAVAAWAAGIAAETAFWAGWIATRGAAWPQRYAARLSAETPLAPWLTRLLAARGGGRARVLDVGAGPATTLGCRPPPGLAVEILACDALAPLYDALLARAGVAPPTRTVFGVAEALTAGFAPDSFDVVHCRNALDHALDPLAGILEMLRVAKPGGVVVLDHHPNEADREGHAGFHRHNFEERGGRFVIRDRSGERDVGALLPAGVSLRCHRARLVHVRLMRQGPMPPSPPGRAALAARVEAEVRRHLPALAAR